MRFVFPNTLAEVVRIVNHGAMGLRREVCRGVVGAVVEMVSYFLRRCLWRATAVYETAEVDVRPFAQVRRS